MSERLIEQRKRPPQLPMAARAIGLCEGCTVAQFCVIKEVAPCVTPAVKEMHIDAAGGGYDSSTLDKPVQLSYQKEFDDPNTNRFMANLQKAKELKPIQPTPAVRSAGATIQPSRKIQRGKQSQPTLAPVVKKPKGETMMESEPGLIAGIFASMIGVKGLATVRGKNGV